MAFAHFWLPNLNWLRTEEIKSRLNNILSVSSWIFIVFLFFFCAPVHAATIHGFKDWLELNVNRKLFDDQPLLYSLNLQGRFDTQKNQFEQGVFTSGIGYQYSPMVSLWVGYQWHSYNLISGARQQNRVWEQVTLGIIQNDHINFSLRTRLEERKRVDNSQWSYRLRERVALKFPKKISPKVTPVIYDELFINLNNPNWVDNNLFNQNRAFIGIDILTSKNTFLEAGYMNQYLYTRSNKVCNHILLISFNFA